MLNELRRIEKILDNLMTLFISADGAILIGGMTIQELILRDVNPTFVIVMIAQMVIRGFGYLYLSSQNCKEILKLELNSNE